jgi:hypothetical protein
LFQDLPLFLSGSPASQGNLAGQGKQALILEAVTPPFQSISVAPEARWQKLKTPIPMRSKIESSHSKNCCAIMMMLTVSLLALPLSGATFLVGDQTQLGDAIVESNTNSVSDSIELTGNIGLTFPLPVIASGDDGLTILGGGFTLSRDSEAETEFGILRIDSGLVEIENLTISGGIDVEGGGVYFYGGELTLIGCTVTGNSAETGGGIMVESCDLTLNGCTVSNNTAELGAGIAAIGNDGEGSDGFTVTLIDCTIAGNTVNEEADGLPFGGGILIAGGELLVSGCTILNNSAPAGAGIAGVFDTNVTLSNTTISGNTAMIGGGVLNFFGSMALVHCTVTGNAAQVGGGVANANGGTLTLLASVIAGNEPIAGNEAAGGAEIADFGEVSGIVADGSNVFGHSGVTRAEAFDNFIPGGSDRVCTSDGDTPTALAGILNPTLADNGGPTLTYALVAGSPAIDLAAEGPEMDQRGISRPQGTGFDAGAFELEGGSAPEPDPEPSGLYEEYWHTGTANTISSQSWNLDPSGILGDAPEHTLASGALPKGLSLVGKSLVGTFSTQGNHAFILVSRSGMDEVRNHFYIQVIPPTLTPLIVGFWVNGDYQPTVIMQDRTHGGAAVTELINVTVPAGNPLELKLNWDYIKGEASFRIIRGNLPQGLTLREQVVDGKPLATIEGTPTQTGEFIFVVSVLDWRGRGYQWIRLVVE